MKRIALILVLCSTLHAQTVDKKFVLLNGLQFGAAIGDVLTTRHCIAEHTCREGNPLMPQSAGGQFAVTFAWGGASTAASYELKKHGHAWWIMPLAGIGVHVVGIISGARK